MELTTGIYNIGGIIEGSHFFFAWYHAEHVLVVVYLEAYGKMWSKQNFSSFNCLPAEATVLDINLLDNVHFRRGDDQNKDADGGR